MKNYKYVIVTMHNLRGSSIHHNVLNETNKLMEENGYEFEKAFRMSMKRHQIAFEDLIKDNESDSSDSEAVESSDSSGEE